MISKENVARLRMRDTPNRPSTITIDLKEIVICSVCGFILKTKPIFCENCGQRLNWKEIDE